MQKVFSHLPLFLFVFLLLGLALGTTYAQDNPILILNESDNSISQPLNSETENWDDLEKQLAEAQRLAEESLANSELLSQQLKEKQTEIDYWYSLSQESENRLQKFVDFMNEADVRAFDLFSVTLAKYKLWKGIAVGSFVIDFALVGICVYTYFKK